MVDAALVTGIIITLAAHFVHYVLDISNLRLGDPVGSKLLNGVVVLIAHLGVFTYYYTYLLGREFDVYIYTYYIIAVVAHGFQTSFDIMSNRQKTLWWLVSTIIGVGAQVIIFYLL